MVASSNLTIDLESNQTILGLFYLIYILGILIFINTNKKKSPFLKDLNNNTLVKKINITNNSLTYAGLLSMSGMPPFTGFIVKYLILLQVINLFSMNIATIIVSFSIIATFCYIRPIISFSTPEVFKSLKFLGDKRLQNKIDGLPFHDLILISFSVILLSTIIFIFA
jgi:NADH:ubiquinone oxidoreductase subunit 2 (subunit N)